MTKIPVTFISSVTKVQPTFALPEPIQVNELHSIRSR